MLSVMIKHGREEKTAIHRLTLRSVLSELMKQSAGADEDRGEIIKKNSQCQHFNILVCLFQPVCGYSTHGNGPESAHNILKKIKKKINPSPNKVKKGATTFNNTFNLLQHSLWAPDTMALSGFQQIVGH